MGHIQNSALAMLHRRAMFRYYTGDQKEIIGFGRAIDCTGGLED